MSVFERAVQDTMRRRAAALEALCVSAIWAGYAPATLHLVVHTGKDLTEVWSGDWCLCSVGVVCGTGSVTVGVRGLPGVMAAFVEGGFADALQAA